MNSDSIPYIINLLQSSRDVVACLLNCSNNGECKTDSNETIYFCSCNQYFTGESCEKDLRLCSNKLQCLNNGTCLNIINASNNNNNYDFNCTCDPKSIYYGRNCELKLNICQNVTCSQKGICYINNTNNYYYYCKCFIGYTGQSCQFESNQAKTIKTINNMSAYISIIIIVAFFISILLLDLCHYWSHNSIDSNNNKRKINNKKNKNKNDIKVITLD